MPSALASHMPVYTQTHHTQGTQACSHKHKHKHQYQPDCVSANVAHTAQTRLDQLTTQTSRNTAIIFAFILISSVQVRVAAAVAYCTALRLTSVQCQKLIRATEGHYTISTCHQSASGLPANTVKASRQTGVPSSL